MSDFPSFSKPGDDLPDDDLQFETVEVSPSAPTQSPGKECEICHIPITSTFYALRDSVLCPECREQIIASSSQGFPGFVKATVLGVIAGAVGAAAWCVIRLVTNLELGIVAVVVGYMVGKSVRKGSGDWGGLGYQFLAVLITYLSVAATFIPLVMKLRPNGHLSVQLLTCITLPAMIGFHRPITLIIYGIALWEAWKFTARRVLPIAGPFQVAASGDTAANIHSIWDTPAPGGRDDRYT